MNAADGFQLARSLMEPTGIMGYLVTRGPAWPPAAESGPNKKAIGRIMGEAYCLLRPLWDEHPELDPGSTANTDPLKLEAEPHPAEAAPQDLLPYIDQTEQAASRVVAEMLQDVSLAQHKQFIESAAQDLNQAIADAKQVFGTGAKK